MTDPRTRHLLLLSVDGMSPDLYLAADSPFATLRQLAREWSHARAVEPVYPSVTVANHASMVTGTRSGRHGVLANTRFDPERLGSWESGESRDWYFDAGDLRSLPLWDAVREAGGQAAILRWPVSRGARARWCVPEVFVTREAARSPEADWDLLVRSTDPRTRAELMPLAGIPGPMDHPALDRWICRCIRHLARERAPALVVAHLTSLDHAVHDHARGSSDARRIAAALDRELRAVFSELDPARWTVIVAGDHGFMNFTRRLHLNALFAERGWLRPGPGGTVRDWQVVAQTNCGQAAIYVREPALGPAVLELLRRRSENLYQVLDRERLDALEAFPEALCAVEPFPGMSMGQRLEGPLVEETGEVHGEHGYLPHYLDMQAGLVVGGHGAARGADLGHVELIDIAPTAAELLGVALPGAQGRVIEAALDPAKFSLFRTAG